jgi:hypothetical protein
MGWYGRGGGAEAAAAGASAGDVAAAGAAASPAATVAAGAATVAAAAAAGSSPDMPGHARVALKLGKKRAAEIRREASVGSPPWSTKRHASPSNLSAGSEAINKLLPREHEKAEK